MAPCHNCSPGPSMTISVVVDGLLNQISHAEANRDDPVMPQVIIYIFSSTCNKW